MRSLRWKTYTLICLALATFAVWAMLYIASNRVASALSAPVIAISNPDIALPTNAELLNSTNVARGTENVPKLQLSEQLNRAAQLKCNDMVLRDYWAHTSPDGTEPWDFMERTGYQYSKAAENLFNEPVSDISRTAQSKVTGWLNSPSHRASLLNSTYQEVGFGTCYSKYYAGKGERVITVQMFGAQ